MSLDQQTKLHLSLIQVEGVMKLIEGNEYEKYMYLSLNSVKWELSRQLLNLNNRVDNSSDSV